MLTITQPTQGWQMTTPQVRVVANEGKLGSEEDMAHFSAQIESTTKSAGNNMTTLQ